MKKILPVLTMFCLLAVPAMRAQTMAIDTFYYTGSTQTFVIPQCVSNLTIMLHGAQGGRDTLNGGDSGGYGGRVYVVMTATPGTLLYVNVGGPGHRNAGGWNGGGNGGWGILSPGGGGGGASDIRLGSNTISNRIFVAGGGGGGGGFRPKGHCIPMVVATGGGGGGMSCTFSNNISFPACPPTLGCGGRDGNNSGLGTPAACSGGTVSGTGAAGGGGGMTSGGGVSTHTNGCPGTPGSLFQGGSGGDSTCTNVFKGIYGGGGGGGGYYGGGGGHSGGYAAGCPEGGGGGGGSTFLDSNFVLTYSLWGGGPIGAGIFNPITLVHSGAVTFSYTLNGMGVSASVSQNSLCSGTPVLLTATGANSYTWLPAGNFSGAFTSSLSVNPTTTTQYTVQGDNGTGCLSQTVVTAYISAPGLSVTASPAYSVCAGHPVSLSVSGATSFSWSGGIQNNVPFFPLTSGVYTVNATDSLGCSGSVTASIDVVQVPKISVTPSHPAICSGDSVGLSASGANTYSWSTGHSGPTLTVSPVASTIYSVTGSASATNMACQATGSTQVQVFPPPVLSVTATRTLICLNEQTTISAGGAITYTWRSAPGSATVNPGSMVVGPLIHTTYSVTGTAATNCSADGVISIQVDPCTGITDLADAKVSIFPNPARGAFYVHADHNAQITVYSCLGNLVVSGQLRAGERRKVMISTPGIYMVRYQVNHIRGIYKLIVLD